MSADVRNSVFRQCTINKIRREIVFSELAKSCPLRGESKLLKWGDRELSIASCQITNSSVGSASLMWVKFDFFAFGVLL